MHGAVEEAAHEVHGEEVHDHAGGAPEGRVLADPLLACAVHHLHLGDAGAVDVREGRQVAVELAVGAEHAAHVRAVRLKAAAVVVQAHAGDPRDEPVGAVGGEVAQQHVVLALPPPPTHHVVSLPRLPPPKQLLQQPGDVRGVVLKVPVQRHKHAPRRLGKPCGHGSGLPKVPAEGYGREVAAPRGQLLHQGTAPVPAPVVHQHDLVAVPRPLHGRGNAVHERRDVLHLVVDRHDDRHVGIGSLGIPPKRPSPAHQPACPLALSCLRCRLSRSSGAERGGRRGEAAAGARVNSHVVAAIPRSGEATPSLSRPRLATTRGGGGHGVEQGR
mmetsp:Transcript_23094/g.72041  ORF Transcript_23094/g.72041 Transcript_23094/m.72041 type:complete len:329 (+) Transcript_23094:501-1487(+)